VAFQFSIRSLLVLVITVAVPCSWLAVEMQQAITQKEAVEGLAEQGGFVGYDYEMNSTGFRIRGNVICSGVAAKSAWG